MNNQRPYRAIHNGGWKYGWLSYDYVRNEYLIVNSQGSWPVIESTIGQQVGLQDKHGKEGYFGDIVKHASHGVIGIIKWDKKALRVYFDWNDGSVSYPIAHYDYIDIEIIGTIHTKENNE